MVRGIQKFNRITAAELLARPTYAQEFQNIRENVHKIVVPNDPEAWERSQKDKTESNESRVKLQKSINNKKTAKLAEGLTKKSKTRPETPKSALKEKGDLTFKPMSSIVRFKEIDESVQPSKIPITPQIMVKA